MDRIISKPEYDDIERAISSDKSVVGIDAKKTHIIIIHMLRQIEEKMDSMNRRLSELEEKMG